MAVRVFGTRLAVEGDAAYKSRMRDAGRVGQDAMQRVGRSAVPASRGLRLVSAAGLELKQSMEGVASSVPAVGALAGTLGPAGLAIAAVGVATVGLAAKARTAAQEIAAVGDAADRAGVSAEFFEQLSAAIVNSGQKVDGLEAALAKLNVRIGEARDGGKLQQETFAALGVTMQDLATLPTGEIILNIADALAAIEDPGRRAVLMQRLFEEGGRSLLPVLAQGSEKLREMFAEADRLGQLYGGETIRKSQELSAEMARQSELIDKNLNKAFVELAPAVVTVTGAIAPAIRFAREYSDELLALASAVDPLIRLLAGLKTAFDLLGDSADKGMGASLGRIDERIAQARSRLDALRPSDKDEVPARLRSQFEDAEAELARLQQLRENIRNSVAARPPAAGAAPEPAATPGVVVPKPRPAAGASGATVTGEKASEKPERDVFAEAVERSRERTEALRFEAETAGMAAETLAYLTTIRELESAATADGTEVSRAERQAIIETAAAQAQATAEKERGALASRDLAAGEREAQRRAEDMMRSLDEMSSSVGDSLGGLIAGTNTWRDALGEVLDVALRIAEQQLQESGLLGQAGGFVSSLIGGLFGGGFADGAAFHHGRVIPFANGTVISRPTMFPMSSGRFGVMAERDPEAIMPLVKTASGALGVRAEGAAGGLVFNSYVDARGATMQPGEFRDIAQAEAARAVAAYDRHAAAPSIRNASHRQRF